MVKHTIQNVISGLIVQDDKNVKVILYLLWGRDIIDNILFLYAPY